MVECRNGGSGACGRRSGLWVFLELSFFVALVMAFRGTSWPCEQVGRFLSWTSLDRFNLKMFLIRLWA
jgi:hypothetical protein